MSDEKLPARMLRLYYQRGDGKRKASRWMECPVCGEVRQMAPKRGRRIPMCDHGATDQARFSADGGWDLGGGSVVVLELTEGLRAARWEALRLRVQTNARAGEESGVPAREDPLGWVLDQMRELEEIGVKLVEEPGVCGGG